MTLVKKRWFAYLTLALAVVLTIFPGGARGLLSQRAAAVAAFETGETEMTKSIAEHLQIRAESALSIAKIAERSEAPSALIEPVQAAGSALLAAPPIGEAAKLNETLDDAAGALMDALKSETLADRDRANANAFYAEFLSSGRNIKGDAFYEARAAAFNKLLNTFPAGIIARAAGIGPLESF